MGMLGGLMGAAFIQLNVRITGWRLRRIPVSRPAKRALEVVAMAAVTGTVMFSASYFSPCVPLPSHVSVLENISSSEALLGGDADVGEHQSRFFPQLWCPAELYSKFGQLFFVPLSEALQIILHLGETLQAAGPGAEGAGASSGNTQWEFPLDVLFTFLVVCFGLMTCTYGVGAATGLFVPSLAVGAGMGQAWPSAKRGSLPVAWALDFAMAPQFPALFDFFVGTARQNDTFIAALAVRPSAVSHAACLCPRIRVFCHGSRERAMPSSIC